MNDFPYIFLCYLNLPDGLLSPQDLNISNIFRLLKRFYVSRRHNQRRRQPGPLLFVSSFFKVTKSTEETADFLRQTLPDIEDKKKGHVDEYPERTVFKAKLTDKICWLQLWGSFARTEQGVCRVYAPEKIRRIS